MRRSRHSRTSGRQQALGDLFAPDTLEGDPTPRAADDSFPLRPFAAEIPQATGVDPHAEAPETPAERLLRLARESASRGRRAEAEEFFRELLELEPGHLAGRVEVARLHERHGGVQWSAIGAIAVLAGLLSLLILGDVDSEGLVRVVAVAAIVVALLTLAVPILWKIGGESAVGGVPGAAGATLRLCRGIDGVWVDESGARYEVRRLDA